MYTFSIIIPHRNIPTLLRRCLDSIPHRDDVQIIVIDDNSDANKVDFSKFPGLNEKNTEVYFTKEGKGAGYTRNVGLKHAKGEWLLFADADDMFMPQIEDAFEFCSKSHADVIYLGSCAKDSETLEPSNEMDPEKTILDSYLNDRCYDIKYRIHHPWGKFIKHSFIIKNNIIFEEVSCSNDTRFSVQSDYYANLIDVFPAEVYCYMVRSDSLWHNVNLEWARTRFGVMLRVALFFDKKGVDSQKTRFVNNARVYLGIIRNYSLFYYYIGLLKLVTLTGIRKEYINSAIKKIKRKVLKCK